VEALPLPSNLYLGISSLIPVTAVIFVDRAVLREVNFPRD